MTTPARAGASIAVMGMHAAITGLLAGLAAGLAVLGLTGGALVPVLGAGVLLVGGSTGTGAGMLAAHLRRRRVSWRSFERDFWTYVREQRELRRPS